MRVQDQLKGTGVAVITPFTQEYSIDFPALGKVLDFLISNRTEYIVLLGTTGETPVLSTSEKIAILEYAYERIAGRVPVVVGIGGNDTAHLLEDFKTLPLQKATAILSAAPYYNKPSQEGIFQHYKLVAEASPKPIILYNVPGRTGRNMSADTTLRLANEVPNIIGIKEASGDMAQCMQILKDRPEGFLVLSGDDALALPQIACGMEGVISVAANAFPLEFGDMVRACLNNDFKKAKQINDTLIPTYDLMFAENNPAGVKAFMYKMGLIKNQLRLPNVPLSQPVFSAIEAWMVNNR